MSLRWSHYRQAARQQQLSHQQLQALLESQAAAGHWARIRRWLPLLNQHSVAPGERQGSAVALAAWLQRRQRHQLAQSMLQQVGWDTAEASAWLLRAQVALSLGEDDAAERHLIRAVVLPGGQATAAYRLGQLQRSRGRFDQAASWFLASLSSDPDPFHIHNELQFTRCSDALLPELVGFYAELCQRCPEQALPRQLLAHYLLKQGRLSEAITASRKAARLQLGELTPLLAPAEAEPSPPDFVILGAPKGGTTALLRWLSHIPGLWCHPRKELHFFDGRYSCGEAWYCAQFPRFQDGAAVLRGEASPNYFSDPPTPQRLAALMPSARLVVLLRDPLKRAISWVQHLQRLEGLKGSVEHWLEQELNQLEALSPSELAQHPRLGTGALQDSCYDLHLQRWAEHLPDNPPLLIASERLFADPAPELQRVLKFIGSSQAAEPWLEQWRPFNVNPHQAASVAEPLSTRLKTFLASHTQRSLTIARAFY